MTTRTTLTISMRDGAPAIAAAPGPPPITAEVTLAGRWLRIALSGDGDVELRIAGADDVDVRGGYVFALPGDPYVVRAHVAGSLIISARLRRS
jgi:hypothetical protein